MPTITSLFDEFIGLSLGTFDIDALEPLSPILLPEISASFFNESPSTINIDIDATKSDYTVFSPRIIDSPKPSDEAVKAPITKIKDAERYTKATTLTENIDHSVREVDIVTKTKKNGTTTRYFRKLVLDQDNSKLAAVEAICAQLMQLTTAMSITPKVRVITAADPLEPSQRIVTAVVSKAIHDFKTAFDVSKTIHTHEDLIQYFISRAESLAAVLCATYFFADDDMHAKNYGVTQGEHFVRFDGDRCLRPITQRFNETLILNAGLIEKIPKLIIARSDAFHITSDDLQNFPQIVSCVPTHWLSQKMCAHLHNDMKFKANTYYYFLKMLLPTDEICENIFKLHSKDESLCRNIKEFILLRQRTLAQKLVLDENFRNFLIVNINIVKDKMRKELHEYNSQFLKKDSFGLTTLVPKSGLEHLIIPEHRVDELVNTMLLECQKYISDPNLLRQRQLEETLIDLTHMKSAWENSIQALNQIKVRTASRTNDFINNCTEVLQRLTKELVLIDQKIGENQKGLLEIHAHYINLPIMSDESRRMVDVIKLKTKLIRELTEQSEILQRQRISLNEQLIKRRMESEESLFKIDRYIAQIEQTVITGKQEVETVNSELKQLLLEKQKSTTSKNTGSKRKR